MSDGEWVQYRNDREPNSYRIFDIYTEIYFFNMIVMYGEYYTLHMVVAIL